MTRALLQEQNGNPSSGVCVLNRHILPHTGDHTEQFWVKILLSVTLSVFSVFLQKLPKHDF